ncbi:MAG: sulfite exporter TauE/SafE family protein [Gammaproteobacteria bacterium]|nr:sulfite exporter TauE/SafE family protein [Gammaproteobacteria bacterium]
MSNELYLIISIVMLAGFIQGLSGFGSAIIAIPLLTFFLDIKTTVALVTMLGIIIGLINTRELIQHSQYRRLAPLLASSLCGIPVGVIFITSVQEDAVLLILSILLVSYSLYTMRGLKIGFFSHPSFAYIAGFFSGWLGATLSISGPPVILYTTAQNWTAKEKKSVLASYFLLVSILTAIGFYISGMLNDEVMILFGYSVIPLIAGTYLGILAFNKITGTYQNIIINIFVLGLGITLLVKLALRS